MPVGTPLTIVGSRTLSAAAKAYARAAGEAVARGGGFVVSGGALGADRAAAHGASTWTRSQGGQVPVLEILPCGIARWERKPLGAALSLAAPDELFSTPLAMERNALLYAFSQRALAVAPRFKEGGTWVGATDALRRRLTSLFVRADGSEAAQALQSLGATLLSDPAAFPHAEPQVRQWALPVA
jgi:predicted Rossmann fold nucleotide-binding protein DprA/Smf involved in DNA uptake